MALKPHAALVAAGLLVLTPAVALAQAPAQDAPPPAEAAREQGIALLTRIGDQFNGMMRDMGLEGPEIALTLTPEMVAAAIPYSDSVDDAGRIDISVDFDFRELSAEDPPENPQDYVVFETVDECRPNVGQVAYFRTLALDDVVGHQCVVTVEDGAGVWGVRALSVAARGDFRLRSRYAMAVVIEGRPERAREVGESALDGVIGVSTSLADYTTAAAAVSRYGATDDPVEIARRFGRLLERAAALAAGDPSRRPAPTEAAPLPRN